MCQKGVDLSLPHFGRMTQVVEADEASGPHDIDLFCLAAVMSGAECFTQLSEQLGFSS